MIGREPSEELDALLIAYIKYYRPRTYGGRYQLFHERLWALFSGLSETRREDLILRCGDEFSWHLSPIASTYEVGKALSLRLSKMKKVVTGPPDHMSQKEFEAQLLGTDPGMYGDGILFAFGPEILRPFCEILGKKFFQRHIIVTLLAQSKDAKALDGLLIALGDSAKNVRTIAIAGFSNKARSEALDTLLDGLLSRKKIVRESSMRVIEGMEKTAMFNSFLEKYLKLEKNAERRKHLQAHLS